VADLTPARAQAMGKKRHSRLKIQLQQMLELHAENISCAAVGGYRGLARDVSPSAGKS
jgi:hypothetical protein